MMHEREKSDSAIVAVKPPNKAGQLVAEAVEQRAETKGNVVQQSKRVPCAGPHTPSGKAEEEGEVHCTLSSYQHRPSRRRVRRTEGERGPGRGWAAYEADLDRKIVELHSRLHKGVYRAQPSRRVYIPKPDGQQRPLAVAALEDKIVQRAAIAVLNAIYEEDFLGFSYGFRPKRSQHDALDALIVGITSKKVNYILDADIRSYFDSVNQDWLIRFLKHRISDPRMIRLIQKWLRAGILEDGVVTVSETGTGQGSVASPLLSNVYLHYVFDLWAGRWRRRQATGDMIIVRYADDIIIGFQHESDARRFWDAMRERMMEFSLSLHPDKTRLIRFGRFAAAQRAECGLGKPETFTFLDDRFHET
jgi:group II intron reverse transcriptase/maturase